MKKREHSQEDPASTISAIWPKVTHGQKQVRQPEMRATFIRRSFYMVEIGKEDSEWKNYSCPRHRSSRRFRWTTETGGGGRRHQGSVVPQPREVLEAVALSGVVEVE